MDEIAESHDIANEIGEAISNPVGFQQDIDEVNVHFELCKLLFVYTLCLRKKQDTKLLSITSRNVNRFSKFFHW